MTTRIHEALDMLVSYLGQKRVRLAHKDQVLGDAREALTSVNTGMCGNRSPFDGNCGHCGAGFGDCTYGRETPVNPPTNWMVE